MYKITISKVKIEILNADGKLVKIFVGELPKVKKENPNVMNVWCLDKKEWRSFRIANVISAKVKDETNTVQP